jgi:hypothetical protein|nr:MAG TPA: hypothetical protein [Caudoviricetes sp.]DAP61208.1 MAG TPA: hypothetical protein [Caudoviricetes sp.]
MEKYVKANRKVAEFLHLENDRTQFKDGNFLLWMQDIMVFGSLINFNQILAQIGAVALDGDAAKQEQDGECTHLLPVATDERFVIEEPATDETEGKEEPSSGNAEAKEEPGEQVPGEEASVQPENKEE